MKKRKTKITYDSIEFLKLTNIKKFKVDINKIRTKLGIDPYDLMNSLIPGAEELMEENDLFEYLLDKSQLQESIDGVLDKYELSEGWYMAVFNYIVFNESIIVDSKFKPDGISLVHDLRNGEDRLILELGKDTTLDEIKSKWPSINRAIKNKFPQKKGRQKSHQTFFRDYLIYNMHIKNKTIEQIYNEIKDSENEDLDFGNIKTIISRFKKEYIDPESYK